MAVSMAKLSSSSSCRPLLQGMMLLALLLLASIQAGPVMAQVQGLLEKAVGGGEKLVGGVEKAVGGVEKAGQNWVGGVEKAGGAGGTFPRTSPRSKDGVNHVGEEPFFETQGAVDEEAVEEFVDIGHGMPGAVFKKVLSTGLNMLCKKPGWKDFCKGAKMGIKVHKYLCKAQGWMDKFPGGASGTQSYDVRFLAIDIDMSVSFPPSFSYSNSVVICRYAVAELQVFWFPAAGTPVPRSSYP